ncbi:hypothetical protein Bbelb_290330 [Branchiostoma belcheri]|nr:hypothetical protein Bbelb_290330 [Branchiostoma belcheri]
MKLELEAIRAQHEAECQKLIEECRILGTGHATAAAESTEGPKMPQFHEGEDVEVYLTTCERLATTDGSSGFSVLRRIVDRLLWSREASRERAGERKPGTKGESGEAAGASQALSASVFCTYHCIQLVGINYDNIRRMERRLAAGKDEHDSDKSKVTN